jgi:hypothetical protein
VNDAERVRLCERLARLHHVLHGLLDRERPASAEDLLQVLALEILHHHVRRPLVDTDVENVRHVVVLNLGGGARLARETADNVCLREVLGEEKLDRDRSLELQVRRGDDEPHTAAAKRMGQGILPRDDRTLPEAAL